VTDNMREIALTPIVLVACTKAAELLMNPRSVMETR